METEPPQRIVTREILGYSEVRAPYEGIVARWFKQGNEIVEKEEPLCELRSFNSTSIANLLCPARGRLEILIEANQPVKHFRQVIVEGLRN